MPFLRGHRQLGAGFSAGAQAPSPLHFGLDPRRRYDVETTFPSGRRVVERNVRPGRALDVRESPPGVRQAVLGWHWARRAWLAADPRRELAKLGLVLLGLLLWRAFAARRLGARLLVRRWSLTAGLLAAYLLTAGCLAADGRTAVHGFQLVGFAGRLRLAVADRRLTGWARSRTLGPFRLLATLGEGGMGVVYRARHRPTGRIVALKVLHPRATDQEDHRLRFLREARILTRPSTPASCGCSRPGRSTAAATSAWSCCRAIRCAATCAGTVRCPPGDVRRLLAAAADALAYIHRRGIVHRDVKSDNLFLPEPGVVKLTDFGLARASDAKTLTGRVALLGTLAYMPPELLQGQAVDARSDLYSLGVVAYEALTGSLPFAADGEGPLLARILSAAPAPVRRLRPEVPEPLALLVEGLLARDPRDRPASAEALAAALEGLTEGAVPPVAAVPLPGASRWRERFAEARRQLASGSSTEAQMILVECLAEIEEILRGLDAAERERYAREHDVAAVLELLEGLSPWKGA